MGSSAARKQRKAAVKAVAKAAGDAVAEQRKNGTESGDPTEMVTRGEVQRSFAQVDQHIQGLAKMFNHNGQAVQQGFLSNDIWFETLKQLTLDMAKTQKILCDQAGIESEVKFTEENTVDLQGYWGKAQENVQVSMEQQAKAREQNPQEPVIATPGPNDEVLEFGGDYKSPEPQENANAEA